jgi:hypothetical protein
MILFRNIHLDNYKWVFLDHGKAMDLGEHSKAEMALPAAVAQGGRTWKTHLHFSGLIIKANLGHTFRINTYPQLSRDGVPLVLEFHSQTLVIYKLIHKYSLTNWQNHYIFSGIFLHLK